MAIPVLPINLVPPPTFWRQNHEPFGLAALLGGVLALALAAGLSVQKYLQASREGRRIVSISAEAQKVALEQTRVVDSLRQIDTAERLPRYRVAERIFLERALPWSRLTAEMERNLVQDVRLKSFQRIRSGDGSVTLKVRGEAKSRKAEAMFIEALQGNGTFQQVSLEREAERAGGGIDFDVALPVASTPPAFEPVPVPAPQKVDQFGRPLQPGAKVLRTLTGPAVPAPAPVKPPVAEPARPKAPVPAPSPVPAQGNAVPGNEGNNPMPTNPRPLLERGPVFNRERMPRPGTTEMAQPGNRGRRRPAGGTP